MKNCFPFRNAGDYTVANGQCQPSSAPIGPVTQPAGYAAPADIQLAQAMHSARLRLVTHQVLATPHLKRRLGDRIYALWVADQQQRQAREQPNART